MLRPLNPALSRVYVPQYLIVCRSQQWLCAVSFFFLFSMYTSIICTTCNYVKICPTFMADLHIKKTAIALWYSRTAWQSHCKLDSFDLDYALLASVLGQLNPET